MAVREYNAAGAGRHISHQYEVLFTPQIDREGLDLLRQ